MGRDTMAKLTYKRTHSTWILLTACWLLGQTLKQCRATVMVNVTKGDSYVVCLDSGEDEGLIVKKEQCNVYDYGENENMCYLPNGKCVVAGAEETWNVDCKKSTAITYTKWEKRYCACNKGYYGNQLAGGCKACPEGTTTSVYGPTKVGDCNICAVGYSGNPKKNGCVACKAPLTTTEPGNGQQCVCPKGYTKKSGNCVKCPGTSTTAFAGSQTCLCPAGGTPPNCKPCTNGEEVNGKCVCPVDQTGKWPDCNDCPRSLSYRQSTYTAGNNVPCECNLFRTVEDFPTHLFLEQDPKTKACRCRESKGYYLKVVPNWVWNSEYSIGPCDNKGIDKKSKIITLKGQKRLACDASKGYGVSIGSQVYPESGSGPYCIKCNDFKGTVFKKDTTRCECDNSKKYGVNPGYPLYHNNVLGDKAHGVFDLGPDSYCMKCDKPELKLGSIPKLQSKDVFCRCNWEGGYAGGPEYAGGQEEWQGGCYECNKPNMYVDKNDGNCRCKSGYELSGVAPNETCVKG